MAAVCSVLLAGCGESGPDALPSTGYARVESVDAVGRLRMSDGATVRLAGLEGVDRTALADMAVGEEVELLRSGESAARHVRLRRGRAWVQGRLLDAGAARVRTSADDRALAEVMLRREARARRRGRGGWGEGWRVLTAAEAERARGFQVVEGRVRAVGERRGSVLLDFGEDWRRDVSVEAPSQALDDFAAAGWNLASMEGRMVRVRGTFRSTRNGPLLTLDHPEALEMLNSP